MANIINLWNGIVPMVQDVNVASITAFKSMIDETWDKKSKQIHASVENIETLFTKLLGTL